MHRSLTSHLLLGLHFVTLRRTLILHIDGIVRLAAVALHSKLVFLSHALELLIFRAVLILHEFPPLDIAIHLLHAPRLDALVLDLALALPLLPIVLSEVFLVAVQRSRCPVRRFGIWVIQTCVVDELVVASDVLPCAQVIQVSLIVPHSHVCRHLKSLVSSPWHHVVSEV